MTEAKAGIAAALGASLIWGFSPLFYKLLDHIPPLEVLSHRTLWSFVFFAIIIGMQGRLRQVWGLLLQWPLVVNVIIASAMITTNWFLFIYSIQIDRAIAASLGYFIFPLVSVLLGAIVYRDRLNLPKRIAVGLALVAVAVLTWGLGAAPWISLLLACSFAVYSLIKGRMAVGPTLSVTAEVAVLVPLSLTWLWGVHFAGWTGLVGRNHAAFGNNAYDSVLLMMSGPLTGLPLILFTYASRRVAMSSVGMVSYLNPVLQFTVAAVVFGELVTPWHAIALPLICLALAIYSVEMWRADRSRVRADIKSSTDVATPT